MSSRPRVSTCSRPAWDLLVWGSSPVWHTWQRSRASRSRRVASRVREAHSPALQSVREVVMPRSSASAQSACHAGRSRARSCASVRESPSPIDIVTALVVLVAAFAHATCRFETRSGGARAASGARAPSGARARTRWTKSMPVSGERCKRAARTSGTRTRRPASFEGIGNHPSREIRV